MTNLYKHAIDIKQRIIGLREGWGDPRLKVIALEYRGNFTVLTPKLPVYRPSARLIGLPLDTKANIMVSGDDYYVKDIPRSYDLEVIMRSRIWLDYLVDTDSGGVSGIKTRPHNLDDKSGVSYHLILRKEYEQNRL